MNIRHWFSLSCYHSIFCSCFIIKKKFEEFKKFSNMVEMGDWNLLHCTPLLVWIDKAFLAKDNENHRLFAKHTNLELLKWLSNYPWGKLVLQTIDYHWHSLLLLGSTPKIRTTTSYNSIRDNWSQIFDILLIEDSKASTW